VRARRGGAGDGGPQGGGSVKVDVGEAGFGGKALEVGFVDGGEVFAAAE
jgi:hypothetical protein